MFEISRIIHSLLALFLLTARYLNRRVLRTVGERARGLHAQVNANDIAAVSGFAVRKLHDKLHVKAGAERMPCYAHVPDFTFGNISLESQLANTLDPNRPVLPRTPWLRAVKLERVDLRLEPGPACAKSEHALVPTGYALQHGALCANGLGCSMLILTTHFGQPLVQIKGRRRVLVISILIPAIRHGIIANPCKVPEQGIELGSLALVHASTSVGISPDHA